METSTTNALTIQTIPIGLREKGRGLDAAGAK